MAPQRGVPIGMACWKGFGSMKRFWFLFWFLTWTAGVAYVAVIARDLAAHYSLF